VVKFKNEACVSSSSLATGQSSFRNGTCYSQSECSEKGGNSKGSCASGFGVCCVFTFNQATNTINVNDSYLQNPGFPSAYSETSAVTYTIQKCSNDVCWLRLDFEQFSNLGPADTVETTGGACQDSFSVTVSTGQSIPNICGTNTGQHIYVDIGALPSDTATVNFNFGNTASTNRIWDVKASQIPCGANYAPPNGCLQYQTGLTGRITTFNFAATDSQQHLASQSYSHCIRQEAGFCCIQYQVCSDMNSFSIDTMAKEDGPPVTGGPALHDAACKTLDYVQIENSNGGCTDNGAGIFRSKYCGGFFTDFTSGKANTPVCDCTRPFEVNFFTDAIADAMAAVLPNRGVCLEYTQLPC